MYEDKNSLEEADAVVTRKIKVKTTILDQDGNVLLGNIFKDTLENILNSDFCREIIKGFDENKIIPELCRRCTFREKFSK